jgi:hypothetical protein
LSPETGLMIIDEIEFEITDDRLSYPRLIHILEHAKVPYLIDKMRPYYCAPAVMLGSVPAGNQYILKRTNNENLRLPLRYDAVWQSSPLHPQLTRFSMVGKGLTGNYNLPNPYIEYVSQDALFGTEDLYKWLSLNECFLENREYVRSLTK